MTEVSRPTPLRVLLIGAGRRVANNFLPAFACLAPHFEVVGIHARTAQRMVPLAARWNVPAIEDLSQVDFSTIDVVAISVPTDQNATVLRTLLPHAARLRIVIDTPMFRNARELAALDAVVGAFRQVVVTEDFMNFPSYVLLREAVQQGLIGTPTRLSLLNTGFLYHGLALIRSFASFSPVQSSCASGGFANTVSYRLRSGFRGTIVGPYRQYAHGGVVLEGTRGLISEVAADAHFNPPAGRDMLQLQQCMEGENITGYELLRGSDVLQRIDTPEYAQMRAMPIEDSSALNLLRGCGLIVVLRALFEENLNRRYGYAQGAYDSMISRLAARGRFPFDPFTLVGHSAMPVVHRLARIRK